MTQFAQDRHFNPAFRGTYISNYSPAEFAQHLQALPPDQIKEQIGYAPFCRLIFVPNFTDANTGAILITGENRDYLKTEYEARRPEELPILVRYFDGVNAPVAKFLCIILYSKEQLLKESQEFGRSQSSAIDADWGIVGILGQSHDEEEPMNPNTIIRNALGVKEGGSGVPLDRERYMKAVEFWGKHATVKRL